MNVCEPFIRRPIATSLLMAGVLLFGIMGYHFLPVSDLPNVDFPTMVVNTSLPGASPETMASAVATPLERQFATIPGLDSMSSINALGVSQITLTFNLSRKINDVAPDINAAITQATPLLPPGLPQPPTYNKVNPADQPILYMALTSPTLPLYQLDKYGETMMAQRISMVDGVAQVQVFGARKYAVRVQVNPDALASRGIGLDEVRAAVQKANVNLPTGTLNGAHQAFTIQAAGQLLNASVYEPVVVAYRNGAPVRLRDIGRVVDSVEDNKSIAWYVNHDTLSPSVVLAISRQPGTNVVQVAESVRKLLPSFEAMLPPSAQLHVVFDRSVGVYESIHDVKLTLLISLALVVLVIFVFLRNVSATIIPSLALPLCLFGAFGVMYLANFTMDNLSLMALILSVGFVVDDAIVMLENIVRHMEHGEAPFEAALKGSKEIGFTILSMTLSLAAVFIPLLFMGGIIGRLFREFSVTIVVAILISGVVSLTLTPMLCSHFLRPFERENHGALYNFFERVFLATRNFYEKSLEWVLRHRFATLMLSFAILGLTIFLLVRAPKGFIPDSDTSQIRITTEAAQGISYRAMVDTQLPAMKIVQEDPNVQEFFSSVGGGRTASLGGMNNGRMMLHLKPRNQRKLDVDGVIAELRQNFGGLIGMRAFPVNPPTINIGGHFTKSLYQFTLQSPDLDELYKNAPLLEAKLRALPELQDVATDLQIRTPQVNVAIDRDKASTLGVDADQVENTLYDAYGSHWISTIYAPDDQYKVLLELDPRNQEDPAVMSKLYVHSANGQLIPLDAVTRREQSVGPQAINHLGQLPSVTLSFNLKQGIFLSDAVEKVRAVAHQTLPATITTSFQGTAQAFEASKVGLLSLVIIAILFVYLVLGILYESYIHPITILSGLPSAGLGALLTLLIFRIDLNVLSFVGLIMLIGIVKKNAIMQIDFALGAQRNEGKKPLDAIYQGCLIRFRPIMMTTMAAMLGTLPIAIGFGAGGGARRPLGLTVVGGLFFSQLITLYLTPVIYTYLDALQEKARHWLRFSRKEETQAVEPNIK